MNFEKVKQLKFTNWCINNSTSIYVFVTIITLAGYISYERIPKELFPDIVIPTISVTTIYPGASPQDIENIITKPIEKQLKSINGIKKIKSNSISDVSIISAEFNADMDPKLCKQRVSDAVDKAKGDLPNDLKDDPQIQEFDFSEIPILSVNIAGDFPLDKLKLYAEQLKDKIESNKEITRVDIIGAVEREIKIEVDLTKLNASGLTMTDIENAMAMQNLNMSAGELRIDQLRRNVRISGEFNSTQEIENVVVRSFKGNTFFLKDFATVIDGFKEKQDFARLDHKTVITLNVIKRSGENLISAADKIYQIIDEYKTNKFPEGLVIKVTGDTSENTRVQLNDLVNTVILGFIFVVLILMFFMGITNAFFVGLAVPLSCLITFLIIPGMDMTLNVIVLFSLLLALGIIVDDAIVVIENTHRIFHKHRELNIVQAAKIAAGEVFIPVFAGTLTTLVPFFPLLFWPGIIGKFMYHMPVTLIITLGASLFVAFVMNPVFAVSFMKYDEDDHRHTSLKKYNKLFILFASLAVLGYAGLGKGLANFSILFILLILLYHFVIRKAIHAFQTKVWPVVISAYRSLLTTLISGYKPLLTVIAVFVLFILSFIYYGSTNPSVETFPESEPNFAFVYCKMPIGTDANVTDSICEIIEKRVYKVIGENNPLVSSVISNIGLGAGDPDNPDRVATPHKGKVGIAFVRFAERKGQSTSAILEDLRAEFKDGFPGADITIEKERNGPPVGKPISIEISGDDFDELDNIRRNLLKTIFENGIEGIDGLKSDLQISKPEIIIDIDEEKAQREGISLAQIGSQLRTALFGKEISKFRDANDDHPIQLRIKENDRDQLEKLLNMYVSYMDMASFQFKQIPVSSVTSIRYGNALSSINRKNQKRVLTLSSDVRSGFNPGAIINQLKEVSSQMTMPEGYEINFSGEQEELQETIDFLSVAFAAALAIMFLILVTQFNSVVKPLIIFTTVLFCLIGINFGFGFFKITLSAVMTGVGIFALAGIVVRNGILLMEFTDELRNRGESVEEAVVNGGATRLTPVVLTALSTILGLIPLAIGVNLDFASLFSELDPKFYLGGDNVAFWGPLAWTIIFGLIASTFLTLIVVPSMYMLAFRTREKLRSWFPH